MSERSTPTEQRPIVDEIHAFCGIWDRVPVGRCRVRIIEREHQEPVLLISEVSDNVSTSVTNIMEHLAPELLQRYLPYRFEEFVPAMIIEHYPAVHGRDKATYDLVTFESWRLKRVWIGGQARLSLGEPTWTHLPAAKVLDLLGDLADDR